MNIETIANNKWNSELLNSRKEELKKLKKFNLVTFIKNFNRGCSSNDDEKINNSLKELYSLDSLSVFQNKNASSIYSNKLKKVKRTIDYINNKYEGLYESYSASKINPNFSDNKSLLNHFSSSLTKNKEIKKLDYKVNKLCSDAAIYKLKKNKLSRKILSNFQSHYEDLLCDIKDLKLNSDSIKIEKLEVLQLKLLSNLQDIIVAYQKKMKKSMRFTKLTKIAAAITIAGALYNLGNLAYDKYKGGSNVVDEVKYEFIDPTLDIFK